MLKTIAALVCWQQQAQVTLLCACLCCLRCSLQNRDTQKIELRIFSSLLSVSSFLEQKVKETARREQNTAKATQTSCVSEIKFSKPSPVT